MTRALALLTLTCMLIFLACPTLDLAISQQFYDAHRGGFWLAGHPLIRALYRGVTYATWVWIILLLTMIALKSVRILQRPSWHALLLLLGTLAFGPGLLVHDVVKEIVDRPRPRHIENFAGDQPYLPPFHLGNESGKSFVSGHASMGFYLAAFAWLTPHRRRRAAWMSAGIGAGMLIGFGRIAQGAHFLSDIVFAGLVVLWTAWLINALLQRSRACVRAA